MYHKALRHILVTLLCVSQTKAGVNNTHKQETPAHGAASDKFHPKQENISHNFNTEGTKQDTLPGTSKNINFKSDSNGFMQSGGGTSYSTPVPMVGKTGTHDFTLQLGGSVQPPSIWNDDPKVQGAQISGTGGTYALDSIKQQTQGSTQLSSVGIKSTSQAEGTGVVNILDLLQHNSGGTVQNTKADFPSYSPSGQTVNVPNNVGNFALPGSSTPPNTIRTNTVNSGGSGYALSSGSSLPQNSFGINTPNNGGSGYVVPSGSSIPQNNFGISSPNNGGSSYVVPSGSSMPQNSFGINTPNNGGSGYVVPSGSSIPQNSVGVNTPNNGGSGYVLQSGGSIPQYNFGANQGSQAGNLQTTRINSGLPVSVHAGGSVYTPAYKPGGTVSIGGGGFGGSYGLTNGGFVPGYNIGMQQGVRIPSISTRPVSGQISGGMLSGRSQSAVMFPVGTQQIKVGYGTSATMGQVGYIPQTQVRSINQIPTMQRVSVPASRVNPVYTSVATSGRVPATTGIAYSGIPTGGVRMVYGQNQVRSPSVISGAQVRLPSTNFQYMSSAAVPMGTVQFSG